MKKEKETYVNDWTRIEPSTSWSSEDSRETRGRTWEGRHMLNVFEGDTTKTGPTSSLRFLPRSLRHLEGLYLTFNITKCLDTNRRRLCGIKGDLRVLQVSSLRILSGEVCVLEHSGSQNLKCLDQNVKVKSLTLDLLKEVHLTCEKQKEKTTKVQLQQERSTCIMFIYKNHPNLSVTIRKRE